MASGRSLCLALDLLSGDYDDHVMNNDDNDDADDDAGTTTTEGRTE